MQEAKRAHQILIFMTGFFCAALLAYHFPFQAVLEFPNEMLAADSVLSHVRRPKLADGCRHVYLDVGSNIGVQVRKLYQPELYPNSPVLEIFDKVFGGNTTRTKKTEHSGLCSFAFEAHPSHTEHLTNLSKCYQKAGWRAVWFTPVAVAAYDGNISFFTQHTFRMEVAASIFDFSQQKDKLIIPAYDLARFVREEISERIYPPAKEGDLPPAVVMKLDIEGSEYEVLAHMLMTQTLCTKHIDKIFLEWHLHFFDSNRTQYKSGKIMQDSLEVLMGMDPVHCTPTELVNMDDEQYVDDKKPLPDVCNGHYSLSFQGLNG